MSRTLAAIVGGAAGAVALVGIVCFLVWFLRCHNKSVSRTSETGSSDPSQGTHGGVELSLREARRFDIEELAMATRNFSDQNLIGEGKFGEVYSGLLQNGTLVAIKKRSGAPTNEFVGEVRYLSSIQHRNIVALLGYCQENNLQFLVYEYIPNGSVSSHLYSGAGQVSRQKLEFKHRLSIAIGAAKGAKSVSICGFPGLAHLHSISPRLVHKDFKTANVLVDENFIAKVADAGIRNFLGRVDVGPSSQLTADVIFLAPEVTEFRHFSEKSDVYSFGVFLLELVSGYEATESPFSDSDPNLVEWLRRNRESGEIGKVVDQKLGISYTAEGMEGYIKLIHGCVEHSSEMRPAMSYVAMKLDQILEKEMSMTTVQGEGSTATVTLGSQLFRATK